MTKQSNFLLTLSAAAFLVACAGNPPPSTPAPAEPVQAVAVQPTAVTEGLSDERVMDLARGYVALLHARDFERLWQHLAPEAKQRFGTPDGFRSGGERALGDLGAETAVVSERVEPARAGMMADKLYLRVSQYAGAAGSPVRLMIGLKNDGSIAGVQVRRGEQ